MARKPARASAIQQELRQTRPFKTRGQEATIALLRTASVISRSLERVVETAGLSLAQYNALRIVRGSGSTGIPTLSIRERMIEEGTTITRVLDKLEGARLIERERDQEDRRQVICWATEQGKRLLEELNPVVDAADAEAVSALNPAELDRFITMLDAIRQENAGRGAARHRATR
jgi:DNA-binding MarR family transcriptional regulator